MREHTQHIGLLLAALLAVCGSTAAQNTRVDSLSRVVENGSVSRMQRLEALIALSREWTFIRPEQAMTHAARAIETARSMSVPALEGRARLEMGMAMTVLGRRQEALQHFRDVMDAGKRGQDNSLILLARAMHMQAAMPADEAMEPLRLEECDSLAEHIGDPSDRLAFLHAAIQVAQIRSALPVADALYRQALPLAVRLRDTLSIALVRTGQAITWKRMQRADESSAALADGMRIARRDGYLVIESACAAGRGAAYFAAENYDSSLVWYAHALELANRCGYKKAIAGSTVNMGLIYKQRGDLHRALVQYDQALRAFEQLGDVESHAFILVNMGGIHELLSHYERALDCYTHSSKLLENIPHSPYRGFPLTLRGWTLYRMKRHAEARDCLREGIAMMEQRAPLPQVVHFRTLLGWVYTALGETDTASMYLHRGLEEAEAMGLLFTQADAHIGLAELMLLQDQPERAQAHAESAQQLARQIGQAEQIRDASLYLRKSSARLGDYRRAYEADIVYRRMKDSLDNIESNRAIADITERYENERKEQRIMHLEAAQERRELMIAGLAGGGVLLLIVMVLVLLRVQTRRREASLRKRTAALRERAARAESHRLEAENESRERERQRRLTWSLINAQEDERRRVARDLHDGLGQELVVIKNRAKLAIRKQHDPAALRDQLTQVSEMAATAIGTVQGIAHNLRPSELDRLGLAAAIRELVRKAETMLPRGIRCSIDPIDGLFPRETEILIYRIVQEAISNILRHADASSANVLIAARNDRADIVIEDDGCGFDDRADEAKSASGLGLRSMQERSAIVGGSFTLTSSEGCGTRIEISVPFRHPGDEPKEDWQRKEADREHVSQPHPAEDLS